MGINRKLWKSGFYDAGQPGWPCPTCKIGSLSLKADSLQTGATAQTKAFEAEYGFEPDSYEGRFSCLMECGRAPCRELVAVIGTFVPVEEYDGSGGNLVSYYRPKSVLPAPEMIKLPIDCPDEVQEELRGAFTLFWCDLGACLNRIRNSIELLLTDMDVKRYGKKTGGGRVRLQLDSRINVLRSNRPELGGLCDRMLAVKHLGNTGSHPGEVSCEDVFDGFDILEHVLLECYENPQRQMARVVSEINKRKGPRKAGT